ncbi:unnamed protein product [Linum tenue]|uniref:Uncharacterized protein n=1 Tax=Linum tenue TaxID=586396 RepID=A0AAV0IFD8_9ROSI|nr:unnamed protein product [Linum tenue]
MMRPFILRIVATSLSLLIVSLTTMTKSKVPC